MWHNHFGSACKTSAGQLCQPGCGAPTGCAGFSILESCEGEAGLFLCTHKDPPATRKAGKKKITKAAKTSKKASAKKTKKAPRKTAKKKAAKKAAPRKATARRGKTKKKK